MHSGSRGGKMTEEFGLEAARANLSPLQGSARASRMNDTSGLNGCALSTSAALQLSLESKLRAALPGDGTTLLPMIWRQKATPAGRPYCQLLPQARRTSGSGSGLWPTPNAVDYKGPNPLHRRPICDDDLPTRVLRKELWPTPSATLGPNAGLVTNKKGREGGTLVEAVSNRMIWPTPTARDWRSDKGKQSDKELYGSKGKPLPRVVGGALNPMWVAWLMGYPPEWISCAPSATPSSRKSRQSLSGPAKK